MYTGYTYQDWLSAGMNTAAETSRGEYIKRIVSSYRMSDDFRYALEANTYFRGCNPVVCKKTILKANVMEIEDENGNTKTTTTNKELVGNRIPANFLFHFVSQQNQYLLGNGVTLKEEEQKARLGVGFDRTLQRIGECALLHGVSWGFWNLDHIEPISAASDELSGFVALLDEVTGVPMVGVQFWQLDVKKSMNVRLFEVDGYTVYRESKNGALEPVEQKRAYVQTRATDAAGSFVVSSDNYSALPVIPLYANDVKLSELTPSIKNKIDLYDRIMSDFGDNLDQANDVYWVLNNYSGSVKELSSMMRMIDQLRLVVNQTDGMGGGATAEPRSFEVPYEARRTALELISKQLYEDYMALDMHELTGGSLTNVAISAAMTNLNLKCDRYEWQVFQFVQNVLRLIGIETEEIAFKRQVIVNKSDIVADIYTMRADIDHRTALKLNPYIMQEEIEEIISNVDAENTAGLPSMDEINARIEQEQAQEQTNAVGA